jgi:Protein of unknown function (DUF2911)
MKKSILLILGLFLSIGFTFAQSAPKSPAEVSESDAVKVTYGAPSVKGREIFGKLVPFDKVWRTGANAATEITFKKDANFGGKAVKAGTYTLFTIPGEKEWKVILNSELKQWGSYDYDKIKSKNVAEVSAKVSTEATSAEKLNISAKAEGITITWDKTSVMVPIK